MKNTTKTSGAFLENSVEKGYIIAVCTSCNKETARIRLQKNSKQILITCPDCKNKCSLIHISVEEIEKVAKEFLRDEIRKEFKCFTTK